VARGPSLDTSRWPSSGGVQFRSRCVYIVAKTTYTPSRCHFCSRTWPRHHPDQYALALPPQRPLLLPEVAVPFFGSPTDQVIALQTSSHLKPSDAQGLALQLRHILIIPIAKLLHHISATENNRTSYIPWYDWGPMGTCRVPDPRFSHHFQSALSGPRFIPRPEMHNFIGVWDFSRAHVEPHSVRVPESVPCVQREAELPVESMGRVTAAISEDVIVLRETRISEERVYLLVF